jgi:hypothetical protein
MQGTQALEWFSNFKSGVTSVENAECYRPLLMSKTDENVNQVMEFVLENIRIITHEAADMVGISFGSVHSVLKDNLNMCLTATEFVL